MDCLCCAQGGAGPPSDTEFLGSVCNLFTPDGQPAVFPAEPGRYTLYLIAGCPFAARPWMVSAFYGLHKDAIRIVKCFPAAYDEGWFFQAVSDGEKELLHAFPDAKFDVDPHHEYVTHLKELYLRVNPEFKGAISVPLLWDTVKDTAVSNSSLGLAEMMATQMRSMATQNQDRLLFPSRTDTPELYQEHNQLTKSIHARVTTPVYKINATQAGREHDELVDQYYAALDEYETKIATNGPYLMGKDLYFCDLVLCISLIRLDLAYQWRFGLGRKSVRENYPTLWDFVRQILRLPGMADTVLPRDIMALYFLTPKWVVATAGRTLPKVPESWETGCTGDGCYFG